MNLKSIALLATSLIAAGAAVAQNKPQQSCGAGTCSKKETKQTADTKKGGDSTKKEGACSKKEASCSKK